MNAARPVDTTSRLDQHRLALLPVSESAKPADLHAALLKGGPAFVHLVVAHDLGPLWHHRLQSAGSLESLPPALVDALHPARMSAAAGYLAQHTALVRIDSLFEASGIHYAVMKGAQLREHMYPDPSLRPASDIDILVSVACRARAA